MGDRSRAAPQVSLPVGEKGPGLGQAVWGHVLSGGLGLAPSKRLRMFVELSGTN